MAESARSAAHGQNETDRLLPSRRPFFGGPLLVRLMIVAFCFIRLLYYYASPRDHCIFIHWRVQPLVFWQWSFSVAGLPLTNVPVVVPVRFPPTTSIGTVALDYFDDIDNGRVFIMNVIKEKFYLLFSYDPDKRLFHAHKLRIALPRSPTSMPRLYDGRVVCGADPHVIGALSVGRSWSGLIMIDATRYFASILSVRQVAWPQPGIGILDPRDPRFSSLETLPVAFDEKQVSHYCRETRTESELCEAAKAWDLDKTCTPEEGVAHEDPYSLDEIPAERLFRLRLRTGSGNSAATKVQCFNVLGLKTDLAKNRAAGNNFLADPLTRSVLSTNQIRRLDAAPLTLTPTERAEFEYPLRTALANRALSFAGMQAVQQAAKNLHWIRAAQQIKEPNPGEVESFPISFPDDAQWVAYALRTTTHDLPSIQISPATRQQSVFQDAPLPPEEAAALAAIAGV